MQKSNIDYRFKILYALGMIFITAGHCGNGGISLLYEWFPPYAFHLGLFVFCSGYFYKDSSEEKPGRYILKKVKHLLIPLYLWNFAYAIFTSVMKLVGFTIGDPVNIYTLFITPLNNGHQYGYNLGSWFIAPLLTVEIFNVLFRKGLSFLKGKAKEIVIFVIYFALGALGVILANMGWLRTAKLFVVRALFFLPFYAMGSLYKNVLEKHDKLPSLPYFAIIGVLMLVILGICGRIPTYSPSWCNDFIDGPVMPFLVGYLGIFFWLRVATLIEPIFGRNKYVNLIADNTYSIMVNQYVGFLLVKVVYFLLHRFTPLLPDFRISQFLTNLWYFYLPGDLELLNIFYLIAGITVPILIQLLINKIKPYFIIRKKQPQTN